MDMAGLAFFDECTERVDEENGMSEIKIPFSTLLMCIQNNDFS